MPIGNKVEVTLCLTDGTKLTKIEDIVNITTFLEQHEEYVKIVRCGACKWFVCNMREDGYLPPNVPAFWCKARQIDDPDPTDYCSLGERKEGVE